MLAGRYRIVSLLGRGGMGEVYRADDLRLGQPVALKFLPRELERDRQRLDRFLNEARVALRVTHSNVCRVHDIGDVNGRHYISMEYIDGEDLASLLRRIGRLPEDKAVQLARQLCAGLTAAHEEGILHRDLKPANVMIDGRGRAKITDFGLASLAEAVEGIDVNAGTPGYMAPEQADGREVTQRSDIYALGLVLYELFTGKRAYEAGTREEMLQLQRDSMPSSPSGHVEGLDASIERTILRCLEPDPRQRPRSALSVAVSLPGGDPLAAALAAGETPSPEMVAAAGESEGLRPAVAWAALAAVLTLLAIATAIPASSSLLSYARLLPKPPEVLVDRSQEILGRVGHDAPAHDRARGFGVGWDYLGYIADQDPSTDRWGRLKTDREWAYRFWYRQSPRLMAPRNNRSVVGPGDPPLKDPGAADVELDAAGRLLGLTIVPPRVALSEGQSPDPDWSVLFEEAQLEDDRFQPVTPMFTPRVAYDARAAWTGTVAEAPDIELRVEAAAYGGRVVEFGVSGPWRESEAQEPEPPSFWRSISGNPKLISYIVLLVLAAFLARRNLRQGRGDPRGAFRLALFLLLTQLVAWALISHHTPNLLVEWDNVVRATGHMLFFAGMVWLFYVGLEPFVRRRWPTVLVSWTRVLAGRLRDPLVGRDILGGAILGLGAALIEELARSIPVWFGSPPDIPRVGETLTLGSPLHAFAEVFDFPAGAIAQSVWGLLLLLILRTVLRKPWLGNAALVALGTYTDYPWWAEQHAVVLPLIVLVITLGLLTILRFGLVGTIVFSLFINLPAWLVVTVDWTEWYGLGSLMAVLTCVALAVYGFHISLRRVWGFPGW
jgi:serine/threonine-protein kinase